MMLGVCIISILVATGVIAMANNPVRNPDRPGLAEHAAVELHRIRRRFELARFRVQVSADANRMRRELDQELDELEAK